MHAISVLRWWVGICSMSCVQTNIACVHEPVSTSPAHACFPAPPSFYQPLLLEEQDWDRTDAGYLPATGSLRCAFLSTYTHTSHLPACLKTLILHLLLYVPT